MKRRHCIVLVKPNDPRSDSYFINTYFHFPKRYLNIFDHLPCEVLCLELNGPDNGNFFAFGKVEIPPFPDSREAGYYFVQISDFKPFINKISIDNYPLVKSDLRELSPGDTVSTISPGNLDEIVLSGGFDLKFKADAHLIRVLGEQLIASEKVGILELIKNAYDAGATYCRVRIEKLNGLPDVENYEFGDYDGPVIIVEDNGSGMTMDVIENGWLRPASTLKTNVKETLKKERLSALKNNKLGVYSTLVSELKQAHNGRIPLGEKGVGRFAVHRLGRKLELRTKTADSGYEYILKINWDDFDEISERALDLDNVKINIRRQLPTRDYGESNSGTQLIICGGREGFIWDQDKITDINNSIVKLNSPNPQPLKQKSSFKVYLECPQIPDLLQFDYTELFKPTFTLDGLVDENGLFDYTLAFSPPKSIPMVGKMIENKKYDLKKALKDYWKGRTAELRKPESGPFFIHIEIWYRRKPWIDGPNSHDFLDYLTQFGGISIYRDGINIFPAEWGAETDWLDLSKRHIKQGFRLSYYNLIGNIEIDQTETLALLDKTDREGLIENQAFKDLTQLVRSILTNIVETEFRAQRDKYSELTSDVTRNPRVLKDFVKQNGILIGNILHSYPIGEDPFTILREFGESPERKTGITNLFNSVSNLEESLSVIEEAQDMLTEQAGYGLAISVSLHEIIKIVSDFRSRVLTLLKMHQLDLSKLEEVVTDALFLSLELKRLRPIRTIRTEGSSEFSILKPIHFVQEVFKRKLDKDKIELTIDCDGEFTIYTRYGAIIQVLSNLIDNSCYWLDTTSSGNRMIRITVDSRNRTVIVADNGPGLDRSIIPYLFQPGYSLKIPPSGLGLYICKYYMNDIGGDIFVTGENQRVENLHGAQFSLDFADVASSRENS